MEKMKRPGAGINSQNFLNNDVLSTKKEVLMSDVEIDLEMLEDMCSDISEAAVLFDKSSKIIWINSVLKSRLGFMVKDLYTDSSIVNSRLNELYGDFRNNSGVSKTFDYGKLLKHSYHLGTKRIMLTSIPIRYGAEVIYVLTIIDEHDAQDLDNGSSYEKHRLLIKSLINMQAFPCFIVLDNKIVSANDRFERLIGKSGSLCDYLYFNIKDYTFSNIKKLFTFSYRIKMLNVISNKQIVGHMFLLLKKNSKKPRASIKLHKTGVKKKTHNHKKS